jgi:amino acid adenylation domain-containing protein
MTTVVPRWRACATPGEPPVAVYEVALSTELMRAVAGVAESAGVPLRSALLTAHLATVALLAAEPEVCTGAIVPSGALVEAGLTVDGPWRKLIASITTGPPTAADTVFAVDADHVPDAPLAVEFVSTQDSPVLRVRYRTADFDARYAARVAGYIVAALTALAADPDTDCATADLLGPQERRHQIYERAGAVRHLPDSRGHELFASRAAEQPDTVAVVHGGQRWTYRQLNSAANRIARALLAQGLAGEEVVAVATERTIGWLAAIIGVFKAGGAYLAVEPAWPAARVATLLEQSRCRLVLTEADLATVPVGVRPVRLDRILAADVPADEPGVRVAPGQLAYIYFTSGSTGLPKGAMCEHAGMLNHLLAKIDDLELGPDSVVAQTAQPSFDISLWQLVAPLLAGGRTVIVDREAIFDVPRFVDEIVAAGTTVLQVVPSYLDVLLRYLEQTPRDLGALRFVSVTGEAISKPLVDRWFTRCPGIRLVNAFGATEASDDTTHEIMSRVPDEDLVPVGRPVGNVTVYVLGPRSTLVPLGSIGEIAYSGVCVGRGYVNDPARTAEVFGDDPFRPGERLYRTGDYGRWLPTGSLEFHGRRDEQVKIQGVRIELGEVENRALAHPAVKAASVVWTQLPGSGKSLVAFYETTTAVGPDELSRFLAAGLPAAAVPARLYELDALPLTANGKVDKKTLVARAQGFAADLAAGTGTVPRTETERRIADAWAQALSRPVVEIGRDDHFFDLGGTSLSALRVVASLGGLVSLDDLVRRPVLHSLAAAVAEDEDGLSDGALLRLLAGSATGAAWALVCMPFAAGGAVNFQPLAGALSRRDPTVAVFALQPPGHDPTRPYETLLDVPELAARVAAELPGCGVPTALWGHCAGVPVALETARLLEDAGHDVRHVFIAARGWASSRELTIEIARVVATADEDLATEFAADSGSSDREFIGRAYRHDTRSANAYLLDVDDTWGDRRLACPATVVVSTDDPLTEGGGSSEPWARFAAGLQQSTVDGGGHTFPSTRPSATAELVLRSCGVRPDRSA